MCLCPGNHLGECASSYQQEKLLYHSGSSETVFGAPKNVWSLLSKQSINELLLPRFPGNSFPIEQCLYKWQSVSNINYL